MSNNNDEEIRFTKQSQYAIDGFFLAKHAELTEELIKIWETEFRQLRWHLLEITTTSEVPF